MRPVILIFTRGYLPGYRSGGPIRTLAILSDRLGDEFEFRIVSSDRDTGDTAPYEMLGVNPGWTKVGKSLVRYLAPKERSLMRIARLMRETPHDVLCVNSFFDPFFTLRPLLARAFHICPLRPLVIAPRGEFSPNALAINRWKKAPYLAVMKLLRVYSDATWQVSSEMEASDLRRVLPIGGASGLGGVVVVAGNVVSGGDSWTPPSKRRQGRLRVCFLSRIAPMKNLDFALTVLSKVAVPVDFDIYGPTADAGYWAQCEALLKKLPANVTALYRGSVPHDDVIRTLSGYDLFFLPTRGENFGHVISEALRAGTPVLVSDRTPWRDVEEHGIGWALPLMDLARFVEVIHEVFHWSEERQAQASRAAIAYAERKYADGGPVEANRKLFMDAASRSGRQIVR